MGNSSSDWIALFEESGHLNWWHLRDDTVLTRNTDAGELASDLPIIACGMPQATPRTTPCTPLPDSLSAQNVETREMFLLPPLQNADTGHLSAGAELAIAGFVALNPEFDGVLCLPGPMTVWAHISAQEIVSFQSCASVRLAQALGAQIPDDLDPDTLSNVMSRPERLATVLGGATDAAQVYAALLGAELAATRPYWLGQQLALLDGAPQVPLYEIALRAQGLTCLRVDGAAMQFKGLLETRKRLPA